MLCHCAQELLERWPVKGSNEICEIRLCTTRERLLWLRNLRLLRMLGCTIRMTVSILCWY